MATLGQNLSDRFGASKKALEQFQVGSDEDLDDRQRRELAVLTGLFSNPAPIRPCDTFNLDHSTTLSILNTILTYLVILLQFKGTDMSSA